MEEKNNMAPSEFLNPARGIEETFEEYRVRRCAGNCYVDSLLDRARRWPSGILKTFRRSNFNVN